MLVTACTHAHASQWSREYCPGISEGNKKLVTKVNITLAFHMK